MTRKFKERRPRNCSATEAIAFHSVNDSGSDCILFTGCLNYGYGLIGFGGKTHNAHRLQWWARRGRIPEGMSVDHVCHNEAALRGECDGGDECKHRRCVNINHLRLVPLAENAASSPNTFSGKKRQREANGRKPEASDLVGLLR